MIFEPKEIPDNKELKEYLGWRATCVTDAQTKNLINKLGDQICMKARFVTYITATSKPQKIENGRATFAPGTKIMYFTLRSKEGKEFLPLFTSEEELDKWKQNMQQPDPMKVIMTFDDLTPIFITNTRFTGVCINPVSDNFIMNRDLVASWTTRKRTMLELALAKLVKQTQGGGEAAEEDAAKKRGPRPVH